MRRSTAPEARGTTPKDRPSLSAALPRRSVLRLAGCATLLAASPSLSDTIDAQGDKTLSGLTPWQGPAYPSFDLEVAGKSGRLSLAGSRGRVVLVNFFATWCAPCVNEFASLNMLAQAISPSGVDVIAVNYGEPRATVERFAGSLPLVFPVVLDGDKAVAKSWDVYTLPTSFVLDRDLVIRFAAVGEVDWIAPDVVGTVKAMLGESEPAQRT